MDENEFYRIVGREWHAFKNWDAITDLILDYHAKACEFSRKRDEIKEFFDEKQALRAVEHFFDTTLSPDKPLCTFDSFEAVQAWAAHQPEAVQTLYKKYEKEIEKAYAMTLEIYEALFEENG